MSRSSWDRTNAYWTTKSTADIQAFAVRISTVFRSLKINYCQGHVLSFRRTYSLPFWMLRFRCCQIHWYPLRNPPFKRSDASFSVISKWLYSISFHFALSQHRLTEDKNPAISSAFLYQLFLAAFALAVCPFLAALTKSAAISRCCCPVDNAVYAVFSADQLCYHVVTMCICACKPINIEFVWREMLKYPHIRTDFLCNHSITVCYCFLNCILIPF